MSSRVAQHYAAKEAFQEAFAVEIWTSSRDERRARNGFRRQYTHLFIVLLLQLVVTRLELVSLLLHAQGVVTGNPREAHEAKRRRGVNGRALAPDEAAGLQRGVFSEKPLIIDVGRRGVFGRRGWHRVFQVEFSDGGCDKGLEVMWYQVRVDTR